MATIAHILGWLLVGAGVLVSLLATLVFDGYPRAPIGNARRADGRGAATFLLATGAIAAAIGGIIVWMTWGEVQG